MRIWSLHPKYLDTKGLLAVWRESLLAQKVLEGNTKGYINHPQLLRFRNSQHPLKSIGQYLRGIYVEATARKYAFDDTKIRYPDGKILLNVSKEQVLYEWRHLLSKLRIRDMSRYSKLKDIDFPEVHPMFTVVDGPVESWERVR
ncbi:hypothetical protein KBB12_03870 [Candidatus Woesebacteria bacterium]|nr:hypothetical protein [Candidatus Woesebacteria bacterium]